MSDTMITFSINNATGTPKFLEVYPAGGSYPRDFSINEAGNLLAIGLQYSSSVVIMERNITSGHFLGFAAEVPIAGQVTSVVWEE